MTRSGVARLVMVAGCVAGCGQAPPPSPHAAFTREVLANLTEGADVLAGIQDVAGAQAAADRFRANEARQQALKLQQRAMRPPTPEEGDRLRQEFDGPMRQARERYQRELARVQRLPGVVAVLQGTPPSPGTAPAGTVPVPEPPPAPAAAPPPPERTGIYAQLARVYGAERVATVVVTGLTAAHGDAVGRLLQPLVDDPRQIGQSTEFRSPPDLIVAHLAPVADVQRLADRISFGTVTAVDPVGRVIRVAGDVNRLRAPADAKEPGP